MQSDLPTRTRSGRGVVIRRSTRGPLDDNDDPLSPPMASSAPPSSPGATSIASPRSINQSLLSPTSSRPGTAHGRTGSRSSSPHIDLSFLLRPSLFSSLPSDTILPPFTSSDHIPPPDASLPQLIAGNHFRAAAIKAASDLCTGSVPPTNFNRILETFQVRLSCLVILDLTPLAAAEAKPLSDLIARTTSSLRTIPSSPTNPIIRSSPLAQIPWPLRLLLLRLSFSSTPAGPESTRRSIMALYGLGAECRAAHVAAESAQEGVLWQDRLLDLGLRVVNQLLAADELDAARRQLVSLPAASATDSTWRWRRALLELRLGDIVDARRTLSDHDDSNSNALNSGNEIAPVSTANIGTSGVTDEKLEAQLKALLAIADGDYHTAASSLELLHTKDPNDALVANNYAVALLYDGRIAEATRVLDGGLSPATDHTRSSGSPAETSITTLSAAAASLFNLATIYELTTERSAERKAALVGRVAALGPEKGGYERSRDVFKL